MKLKLTLPGHKTEVKQESKKVTSKTIEWIVVGDHTILKRTKIRIDNRDFTIELSNGFTIRCKSLEEAKDKAVKFI
jgi:hypothetical protein